jgi:hypothetical protein
MHASSAALSGLEAQMADNPIIGSRHGGLKNSVSTARLSDALDAPAVAPDRAPELLTPKETAAYRRCSIRKLDRERADGGGCPYVRIDGRIFYRRADVDRFIEVHVRGGEARDRNASAR